MLGQSCQNPLSPTNPSGFGDSGYGGSSSGSPYVPITPHVIVQTSDPYYASMVAAYHSFLQNGNGTKPQSGAQEVMVWYLICSNNPQACPPAFKATVTSEESGLPWEPGRFNAQITAVGEAFAASGEVATLTSTGLTEELGSGETVQLFRNVDSREFEAIAETGKFSTGPGQMEGKWFATTGADAEKWGQVLNKGDGITVVATVPKSVADRLYYEGGKLDGIGPGYYADGEGLDAVNEGMIGEIDVFFLP
jgi:hypothetical protein